MLPIIEVNHLSKEYDLRQSIKHETFREYLIRKVSFASGRPSARPADQARRFRALDDVSFEVAQGEVVGIVGRNGAGKSTLLKIISKVTDPTTGNITLRGRLGSLLEVGAGFHPELTGRENIYLHRRLLGMSKKENENFFYV